MSEDENEAYIIFKYEGKQKEILFEEDDDDFSILAKKALKSFNIVTKKNDLNYYYYDEGIEKEIKNDISPTELLNIYNKLKNNLKIEIKKKEENKPNDEIIDSNVALEPSDFKSKKESDSNLYGDDNDFSDSIEKENKTEENKESSKKIKEKCNMDYQPCLSGDVSRSNLFQKHKQNSGISVKRKRYLETLKKNQDKKNEEQKLILENNKLEQQIKELKELIEKGCDDNNDDDVNDELIKEKIEAIIQNTRSLERKKSKDIKDLKDENSHLQKKISQLSIELSKCEKENNQISEFNTNLLNNLSKLDSALNNSSVSSNFNESSFKEKIQITNYNCQSNYESLADTEAQKRKRNKKKNKVKKINELYKKMLESKINVKKDKKPKTEDEQMVLDLKKSQSFSRRSNIIENENKNDNLIHKENKNLKDEIKELQNELYKIKMEIEAMKKSNEQEIEEINNE